MKKITTNGYKELLGEIKTRIRSAQYEALKAVNRELICLYWDIGKLIVEQQKKHGWGKSIVENLAIDLQSDFPGIQGYSRDNLWRMRKFYLHYRDNAKLAPLVQEIGWTHNIIIMEACEDVCGQEFYIKMTRKFGWSKNILVHQIENRTYEKTLLNQSNFEEALSTDVRDHAKLAVKDEYTFDFLELGEEHSEMELERALIIKINRFLIEMGGAFAFMGNQFRIEINGNEFFIDILLYHRRLKCLVAVELKIGKFIPEYVGKMQFYLAALDRHVREKDENPSIGIILCKDKDRTVVEYAVSESKKPIAVAQYKISNKLSKKLQKELPTPKDMIRLLDSI